MEQLKTRAPGANALRLYDLVLIKHFEQKILHVLFLNLQSRSRLREAETEFPRRWDDRSGPLFVDAMPWRVSAGRASQGNVENGPRRAGETVNSRQTTDTPSATP